MTTLVLGTLVLPVTTAQFTATTDASNNTWSAETLDPPTSLSTTGSGPISLNWAATPDSYAVGHRLLRSSNPGGPYGQVAQIPNLTTTSYVDSPPDGTYYYIVRAYRGAWESTDSNEASATVDATAHAVEVNSTSDGGDDAPGDDICDTGGPSIDGDRPCTLRAAIEEANASVVVDTVWFDIPLSDSGYSALPVKWTINPVTALPATVQPVEIDAATQSGYVDRPLIVLDGTGMTGENLLTIEGGNSLVRGFAFHNHGDDAIEVEFGNAVTIQGNFIGLDVDGTTGVGMDYGITLKTDFNLIGGPNAGEGNVLGAITNEALYMYETASNNTVQGNNFGTDWTGTRVRPNGSDNLYFGDGTSNNLVGGVGSGEGNIIANSGAAAIFLDATAGAGNAFLGNSIYDNTTTGIDLTGGSETAPHWVTANDTGDTDNGANDLLNFPSLGTAETYAGTTNVTFDLDVPAGSYRVEFFVNPSGRHISGHGGGEIFQSAITVSAGTGLTHSFPGSVGDIITATATRHLGGGTYGSTSEFSAAITTTPNSPPTADAGGPYAIVEGDSLGLDASGSGDTGTAPLTYAWDLDNDTFYDDAIGAEPTLAWSSIASLGMDDDGSYPISVQVDDGVNPPSAHSATVTITNAAPTLNTTGAAATPTGATYTLTLAAVDPGDDTINEWVIDWGDGTTQIVAGNPPTITHTYSGVGTTFNILAAASDEDGTYRQNDLLVPSYSNDLTIRYSPNGTSSTLEAGHGLDQPYDVAVGPAGDFFVAAFGSNEVVRYKGATGVWVGSVVSGVDALGVTFGPDGNLYVASNETDEVLQYDGSTFAPLGAFVSSGSGGLSGPAGLIFGPDGNLYVSAFNVGAVNSYDGATGASLGQFVTSGNSGLASPEDLTFGPDGNLYVTDPSNDNIQRYDGSTGASLGVFNTGLNPNGPTGLTFSPDGNLYVASYFDHAIHRFDATTGAYAGDVILSGAGGLEGPTYLTLVPKQQVTVTP